MKTIYAIEIISSDSDSTINFTLENHVFRKKYMFSFISILKGLCHLKYPRNVDVSDIPSKSA